MSVFEFSSLQCHYIHSEPYRYRGWIHRLFLNEILLDLAPGGAFLAVLLRSRTKVVSVYLIAQKSELKEDIVKINDSEVEIENALNEIGIDSITHPIVKTPPQIVKAIVEIGRAHV